MSRAGAAIRVAAASIVVSALVVASMVPAWKAFDSVKAELEGEGYEVLRLARVSSPWSPRTLYLGCRDGRVVLSALMVMSERGMFAPPVEAPFEDRTTVFMNREPYRLGSPMFETTAIWRVGERYDRVRIGPLDQAQQDALKLGLLGHGADRISIIGLERGFFFSVGPRTARSRAFLQACGAL